LGSAFIADGVIVPVELGRLPHRSGDPLGEVLGRRGLERLGKGRWRRAVAEAAAALSAAFAADDVVLGGGNAKRLKDLPPGARLGHNRGAFRGGFRLWGLDVSGRPDDGDGRVVDWRVIGVGAASRAAPGALPSGGPSRTYSTVA